MATPPILPGSIPGVPPQGKSSAEAGEIMQAIAKMLAQAQASQGGGPQGGLVQGPRTPQLSPPNSSGAPGAPLSYAPPRGYVPIPGDNSAGMQAAGANVSTPKQGKNLGIAAIGQTVSSIISGFEQKEQKKKANLAENYMMQINSLISSGDPGDRQKAMEFLEDPKIRKTLKTGLDYVPLEEPVPPEAEGIKSAIDKIQQKQLPQTKFGTPPPAPGAKPQPPKMQPVLPQPGQGDKMKAMIQNALMQKMKQDPNSALSMGGASQLTSDENRMAEFYEKGLGMSPAQTQAMSAQEKMEGMKMYEGMMRDYISGQMEMEKVAQTTKASVTGKKIEAQAKIDVASILSRSRTAVADIVKSTKDQKGAAANYAAGSKMYEDLSKTYAKLAETPNLSKEDKAKYQALADKYAEQADGYLNQQMDDELIKSLLGGSSDDK